jgi:toxin ParE1/3/4
MKTKGKSQNKFSVDITSSAEKDLYEIYQYVYLNDSEKNTEKLFSKLYEKCFSLRYSPDRGHIPQELCLLGVVEFLEIIYKPYRIIYQIIDKKVFVHSILDGRRDMQKLLQERLIRE